MDTNIQETKDEALPDLNSMNQDQLEDFLKKDDQTIADEIEKKATGIDDKKDATVKPETAQTAQEPIIKQKAVADQTPADQQPFEVEVGGRKLQFKNKDELLKSYKNSEIALKTIQGRYGEANNQLIRMRQLEDQFNQSQRMIEELKRGQRQINDGQQPTAISQNTIDQLDINFDDFTVDNFRDKIKGLMNNVASSLDKKYARQYKELEEKHKTLEQRYGQFESGIAQKEGLLNFEAHKNNLFSEVEKLQKDPFTGDTLKTVKPIGEINDIVLQFPGDSNQADEQGQPIPLAKLMLPEGDYEKFGHIENLLKYYCPVDENGNIDITRRQLKNIKSAFAAYNVEANLNGQDLATANLSGQRQALDAITRVANQPPVIPNTQTSTAGLEDMTAEELVSIIATDPIEVKKWELSRKKSDRERFKKWQKAQELVANTNNV